jgi:hypothetical protein
LADNPQEFANWASAAFSGGGTGWKAAKEVISTFLPEHEVLGVSLAGRYRLRSWWIRWGSLLGGVAGAAGGIVWYSTT